MKRILYVLGWISALIPMLVAAETAMAPGDWIERVGSANKRLNYVGTFTYQSGKRSETSRIIHRIDERGEYERIEALDGRLREMVRSGDEVRYLIPEKHILVVDRLIAKRTFPAWVSTSAVELEKSYEFQQGGRGRVAGIDAQVLELIPRDALRYRHLLWIDQESGLLLKSVMLNEKGDILEQVGFNEIRIGGNVDRALLKASYYDTSTWREVNVCGTNISEDKLDWAVNGLLPGFRLISSASRSLGEQHADTLHLIFSDGLVAISVFIEEMPAGNAAALPESVMIGATSIYKRVTAGHLITALGEVPGHTLKLLSDAIEQTGRR